MKRHSAVFLLFIAVMAAVSWWLTDITAPQPDPQRKTGRFPDSYAKQLTLISYDIQGVPSHRLETAWMRHYDIDNTSEFEQPRLWQYNPATPPWVVRAEKALASGNEKTLFMPGQVLIDRSAAEDSPAYHIATRDLTVHTDTAYAQTDQPIRLDSLDHWITAIGMQGWLREPIRIKLMNQVRGRYESL